MVAVACVREAWGVEGVSVAPSWASQAEKTDEMNQRHNVQHACVNTLRSPGLLDIPVHTNTKWSGEGNSKWR